MDNLIEITLNKKEDYINKYNRNRISPKLSDYILEECKGISIKEKMKIVIKTNFKMTKEEKLDLVDMIRANYGLDIRETIIQLKRFLFIDLFLAIFGVFSLVIYFLSISVPILSEVILIIGWVFIWEAIYNLIFEGLKMRFIIKRKKELTKCKIEFIDNE